MSATIQYDPIRDLLRGIGRDKLLTADQEVELSKQVQILRDIEALQATQPDLTEQELASHFGLTLPEFRKQTAVARRAKQAMVQHNLRLVVSVAKRYQGHGFSLEELISEGTIGLIRGVEKFDHTKGYKLSTYACVPTSTQILTRRGWLNWQEIYLGEQTLGYNPKTGAMEWTTIEAVVDYEDAPLLRFGDGRWSTLCTPNHKWLMQDAEGVRLRPIEDWPTGGEMSRRKSGMKLVLSAPFVGGDSPITPDEAALLAWVHSDGSLCRRSKNPEKIDGAYVFQTEKKFADDIRALLKRLNAFVSDRAHNNNPLSRKFWIQGVVIRQIWQKARLDDRNLFDLVFDLTPEARKAFNDAWYKADGSQGRNSIVDGLGTKLDALELSLFLDGKNCLRRSPRCGNYAILSWREKLLTARRCVVQESGKGHVWCPSTTLGSWVARDEKGNIFLTGNTWWIRQGITRALSEKSRVIRVPIHVIEKQNKIRKAVREFAEKTGRRPTEAQLSELTGLSKERLLDAVSCKRTLSLDYKIGNGDTAFGDFAASTSGGIEAVEQRHTAEKVYELLNCLSSRQRLVISLRYGLDPARPPMTLEQVGDELGVGREQVRQIQVRAMKILRRYAKRDDLQTLIGAE